MPSSHSTSQSDPHADERERLLAELWALEDAGTGGPWDSVLADLHTRIEQLGRDRPCLSARNQLKARADDDPRVGDMIRFRWPARRKALAARRIVAIDGEQVHTVGLSGRQRDRSMSRARLAAYVRLGRGT